MESIFYFTNKEDAILIQNYYCNLGYSQNTLISGDNWEAVTRFLDIIYLKWVSLDELPAGAQFAKVKVKRG